MRATRRLSFGVAATTALCVMQGASGFDPQPDPPGFERLLTEIRALPAVQEPTPFVVKAFAAAAAVERGQGCTAVNILGALEDQAEARGFVDVGVAAAQLATEIGDC